MLEINQLVDVVFSGLSGLVIDDVTDEGELIRVRARSRLGNGSSRPPRIAQIKPPHHCWGGHEACGYRFCLVAEPSTGGLTA